MTHWRYWSLALSHRYVVPLFLNVEKIYSYSDSENVFNRYRVTFINRLQFIFQMHSNTNNLATWNALRREHGRQYWPLIVGLCTNRMHGGGPKKSISMNTKREHNLDEKIEYNLGRKVFQRKQHIFTWNSNTIDNITSNTSSQSLNYVIVYMFRHSKGLFVYISPDIQHLVVLFNNTIRRNNRSHWDVNLTTNPVRKSARVCRHS